MAQPQMMQIKLSRFDAQPWGFRLQGGTDFAAPLLVQKVNGGSLAETAGLLPGDAVLKINDVDVFNLRHKDAQDVVVRSGNNFVITIQRGGSTWRPQVTPTGHLPQPNQQSPYLQTVTKTSLAHKPQEVHHIGSGYNNSARPFANGGDGSIKSIVNKQYNTPVGIYSEESIAETLSAQAEVLAGGVLGVNFKKNEKEYQAEKSEVLKFLREEETGDHAPVQSHHQYQEPQHHQQQQQHHHQQQQQHHQQQQQQHYQQQQNYQQQQHQQQQYQQPQQQHQQHSQPQQQYHLQQQHQQQSATKHVSAPINSPKPPSTGGLPTGQNICTECERLITGVFVRIKDKNLHVECFKCATCGTSLKNQGYYNFNNKLYCDIHAKLAAMQNPPSGTEGYVPVPIKPNTKLSANTISSALSAHGFANGVSNGNAAPAPAPVVSPTTVATVATSVESSAAAAAATTSFVDNYSSSNNMLFDEQSNFASNTAQSAGDQPFEYVTLTGNVIRSVVPPGKGAANKYKVNQGYARPFGASPAAAAPKSPVSYPPQQQQQQWGQQQQQQQQQAPKPAVSPYATLPRSNAGQQVSDDTLQPQYEDMGFEEARPAGAACFEDDPELVQANRQCRMNFAWPPPQETCHDTPTAAPLYIAPPETQHVVPKIIQNPPPPPPGTRDCSQMQQQQMTTQLEQQLMVSQQQQQHEQQYSMVEQQQQQQHWQSRSAPQLATGDARPHAPELESSSDSYTSTCTTTTTTSEEYQRMYAAQVQAYQMQQAFEQSGSELDYHMDMEVASMQQQEQQVYLSASEQQSGRRSVQECAESLSVPISNYRLIDMVREVTPSPEPPHPPRHVVFADEQDVKEVAETQVVEVSEPLCEKHHVPELTTEVTQNGSADVQEQVREDRLIVEDRSEILESQRLFQPTPEIKIEIPPGRHISPTKIPNPMPQGWINPMVRALTTAPDVPFHMVECLCPKPCDCNCDANCVHTVVPQPPPPPPPRDSISEATPCAAATAVQPATDVPIERPHTPEPPTPEVLRELPPFGSFMAKTLSTAPEFTVRFAPAASQEVPLPEETKPYMPPPMDMKPYLREDYRPKTPLLSALTTAPDKPFEGQFDRDVPIHQLDLPTPKEHLTMSDALRTASDRAYTPLNPENATHMFEEQEMEKEKKKYEFQVLENEAEHGLAETSVEQVEYYTTEKSQQKRKSSAFAAMQAFQPSREPLSPGTPRNSIISLSQQEPDLDYVKYCKAKERNQKRIDYYQKKEIEIQQQNVEQAQTNTQCQMSSTLSSCNKPNSLSSHSSSTVQQISNTSTYASANTATQASRSSLSAASGTTMLSTTTTKFDAHDIIEETAEELEHSEVLFPPPSPLSHLKGRTSSGLHRADTIPKYQRNWTVLSTQSPVRTPEPQELRDNVPLAFVDAPKSPSAVVSTISNHVHKPVAQISTIASERSSATTAAARSSITSTSSVSNTQHRVSNEQRSRQQSQASLHLQAPKTTVPIIVEDRSGPVTMAFQPLDEHLQPDQSQTPTRAYTPSLTNKPAPIIPFYQTPEKLCFDECPATHARDYDRSSASPFPDRARSPAPGPPPNPLSAIRAPRMKENETSPLSPRVLQAGSITTGQSYLGAQQQAQQRQEGQVLSHYESTSQAGMQSYTDKPPTYEERKIGDLTIQKREKESHLEEQKKSQLQSQTTTQVGNAQIERRRRVTEEFEHTQSAKTIEIRTGSQSTTTASTNDRRQSYGKTGYVANQARRLSGLEQEITNLTSQSQAISARAANLSDTTFPQLKSPEPTQKFPISPVFPPHDEPQRPSYLLSASAANKLVGPPPGFQQKLQQQQQQLPTAYGTPLVSLQQQKYEQQQREQQQQKSLSAFSSINTTSSSQANTASCCLTKASATNTQQQAQAAGATCSAQASTGGSTAASGVCPVTGTFCRPGHTCCKQQQWQTPATTAATSKPNNNQNINAYRPNASTGMTAFKPPSAAATATAATANAAAAVAPQPTSAAANTNIPPIATTTNMRNVSDQTNVGDSSGAGGKPQGGAFGATSAPKRGRGVFNKAVAPGVRVPLCNSCQIQIRGPFITALGRIWCPDHFICVNGNCRRPLQDIGFVEEKGDLYCEYCFEKYLAPTCSNCAGKIKGDCLNAIGKHFHPECFTCGHCGKLFGNTPFFLEEGKAYCEADWNELFTTKCFACGFPVEAGDRWVEALNHNYHSQCFNCTFCKQNLEGQSFYNKGGRPFCKNHAR